MDTFLELHLEKRIQEARERANRIVSNQHATFEDNVIYLQAILARHYNMPIFHEYFKNRTIDELIFEIELISAFNKTPESRGQELLKENKEEAASLFDDWAKDDMVEVSQQNFMSDDEFSKISQQFMENGEFK
jgi:vacuolar-type H+-ATPase subunit H